MYLDIFKQKSDQENLKSLQIIIACLSAIIMVTIILSETTNLLYIGLERAILMMTGFWILGTAFQSRIQKLSNGIKWIVYLLFLSISWFVIFIYFATKY